AAAHAQHMISHIYVALGYWDETVEANEKSFAVSEDRLRRKGRPIYDRSHHALHWLEYGYLQQGRYRDALRTMGLMDDDAKASGTEDNLWYHAMMRAGWLVETGRWKDLPPALPTDGVSLSAAAAGIFTQGWSSLLAGDRPGAEKALAEMRERSRSAAEKAKEAEAGSSDNSRNLSSDFHTADVLAKELEGLIAWDAGDRDRSIDLLRAATAAEDAMPYEYGPPVVVKPSHELLGEKLYDLGRYEDAWTQFAASLDRGPRRVLSLLGKARAADRLGKSDDAAETWKTLAEIWKKADPDLPALEEVRKMAPEPKRAAL
ncbi:MAG TPA: hypothetical protein VNI57_14975, partial [Candidatus Saccharimonadales bacterium]|nr:hypothetical protein [Candidatus Saccharimonadales bacterium]